MARIRNIGIMAHIDAGKTTVSERLLYLSGRKHKIEEVHDGGATMDWMVQERERGITITSAVTTFDWEVTPKPKDRGTLQDEVEVHLIDTPGHVDFTIEVSRSLRVLDGAVTVFDGVHGVEPQTETVWRQADRYQVPRIGFINKMDRIGADYRRSLQTMEDRFGTHCAPAALPIGVEGQHLGVVELVERRAWVWNDPADPANFEIVEIPDEMREEVEEARAEFLEKIAIADDDFALVWLEDPDAPTETEIHEAIRRAVLANKLVPVLCGSALRNKGIQPLLNAIALWLPAPDDVREIEGVHPKTREPQSRPHAAKAPLSALAFKVALMGDGGRRLVFVRVYSGTLKAGMTLYNPTQGIHEKISRIFLMHASSRDRLDSVPAGNIVGVLGLRHTRTGDTLCEDADPILLEDIDAYEPVISESIECEHTRDRDKLMEVLGKLADEDPTFRWREDDQTGQTIISGMGELHLEVLADRIRREFGVPVRIGSPEVVYRETITQEATSHEIFTRESEGAFLFGDIKLAVKPRARGTGNAIVWKFPTEDAAPEWWNPALIELVERGLHNQLQTGVLAGNPMQDVEVTVVRLGWNPEATELVGYTLAASTALQQALRDASPARLAPIAEVEVMTPPEHMGDIIGSLTQRRGQIDSMLELNPMTSHIKAQVAIERMFGYATELRSMSQGRASFQMVFSHYDID